MARITEETKVESLIQRARGILAVVDTREAVRALVREGIDKDLAFFAVKGAAVLEGDSA